MALETADRDMYGYREVAGARTRVIVREGAPIPPDLTDFEDADLDFTTEVTRVRFPRKRAEDMSEDELRGRLEASGWDTDGDKDELVARYGELLDTREGGPHDADPTPSTVDVVEDPPKVDESKVVTSNPTLGSRRAQADADTADDADDADAQPAKRAPRRNGNGG